MKTKCRNAKTNIGCAPHQHYQGACMDKAFKRYVSCTRNGGQPHPDDPLKWDADKDEESWKNYDR